MTLLRASLFRFVWLASLMAQFVCVNNAMAENPGTQTLALIVGWNGGGFGLPTLRYADDDALRFATILQDEPSAPNPAKIVVLTELDADTRARVTSESLPFSVAGVPTRARVLSAFDSLAKEMVSSTQAQHVFVIYAGHGLTNRLLLAPENGEAAALSGHELRAAVARLSAANPHAEISLFVDACRSQSLFTTRGEEGLDGPDMSEAIGNLEGRSLGAHVGVITAATSGKPAGEIKRLESGYFSHVLLSGIVGGADANQDDRISFGELAAFVAFHTQSMMGQRPWFDPPAGDLSAITFDHRSKASRLVLPRGLEGRFEVRGPQGRPVFAELFKDSEQEIKLVLPQGGYRLIQDSNTQGHREAVVQLGPVMALNLNAVAWQASAASSRGEPAGSEEGQAKSLGFRSPFSQEIVSTLQTGFDSGRTPTFADSSEPLGTHLLALRLGAASAPLSLSGGSYGVGLRISHLFKHTFIGAEFSGQLGRHAAADEDFSLVQNRLSVQAGVIQQLVRKFFARGWIEGGVGQLWRLAKHTTGDGFVPRTGFGVSFDWRLPGAWLIGISPRAFVQWVDVDASQTRDTGASLEAELSYAF